MHSRMTFARYFNPFEGGRGAHSPVQVDVLARQAWYSPRSSSRLVVTVGALVGAVVGADIAQVGAADAT